MDSLFEPVKLKNITFKNRLMHAPTTFNMSDPEGHVTDQAVGAYESLARGGLGAVTVGATCVRRDGLINERMLGIYDDTYVLGLRDLVDAIQYNDAKAGLQLFYGGLIPGLGASHPIPPGEGWIPNTIAWGPSDKYPIGNSSPRVMPTHEYEAIVDAFGEGARRAREAGFDYLSFHFCHGSLPHTNLSLLANDGRDDKYADRFLFIEEILRRVKQTCGDDFPLIPRFCCDENLEGGYDIAYFAEHYAPRLKEIGIDALDCTFGSMLKAPSRREDVRSTEFIGGNFYTPKMVNAENIQLLKGLLRDQGIDLPLIGSCNVSTPDEIRTFATEYGADIVAVSRLSIDDPEFPNKMRTGREDEICLSTHTGASLLSGNIFGKGVAGSPQNPNFGRDRPYRAVPAAVPKRVVVVGGGSGGMEYARVAHLAGHTVTLLERSDTLGGAMDWVGNYPNIRNTGQIRNEPNYRRGAVARAGVHCRLGVEATAEEILSHTPDVVVLATGAVAKIPDLPGMDEARASGYALTMDEVMARKNGRDPGQEVVVWGAGEGIELALDLARQGLSVRVIESAQSWKPTHYLGSRSAHILRWLEDVGVGIETGVSVTSLKQGALRIERDGAEEVLESDSVIVCQGRVSDDALRPAIQDRVAVVHVIGDARSPRSYGNALHEAAYLARQL